MPDSKQTRQEKLAEILDNRFTIPGTNIRFGIDPILGLLPGIGDWAGGFLSLYFMVHAALLGGKVSILLRMFFNIFADLIIGSIPLLGEVFDVAWKANLRNAKLLTELQHDPDQLATESKWLLWGVLLVLVSVIVGLLLLISWLIAQAISLLL